MNEIEYLSLGYERKKTLFEKDWVPKAVPFVSEEQSAGMIVYCLDESVKKCIGAETKIGVFLSGGLDSSSILHFAAKYAKVVCLSADWGDGITNELEQAQSFAEEMSCEFVPVKINGDLDSIKEAVVAMKKQDILIADPSVVANYFLFKKAKELGLKVVLGGEGSDEFFGYTKHRLICRLAKLQPFRKVFGALNKAVSNKYCSFLALSSEQQFLRAVSHHYNKAIDLGFSDDYSLMANMVRYETLVQLPNYYLEASRIGTFFGIDCRSPIAESKELAEFCLSIPDEYRMMGQKYLFKKAMVGLLPKEILQRKKRGFSIPIAVWLKNVNGETGGTVIQQWNRLVLKLWMSSN